MTLEIQTGAPVNPKIGLYIERTQDNEFLTALSKGEWINIYGSRTMGKSSLYNQYLEVIENRDIKTIRFIAATRVGSKLQNGYEWVCALGETIFKKLGILPSQGLLQPVTDLGPGVNIAEALECLFINILKTVDKPTLLILDEFHYIKSLDYCNDILMAFRDLRECQELLPNSLTLCFVGVDSILSLGEAGTPAKTPFTTPIKMLDFEQSPKTIQTFAQAFSFEDCPDDSVFYRVLELSGGQPYVTMILLDVIKESKCQTIAGINEIADKMLAESDKGKFSQLCESIKDELLMDAENSYNALATYEALLKGSKSAHTGPDAEVLLRYGLVKPGNSKLEIKGELFKRKFDLVWTEEMLRSLSSRMSQYRGGTKKSKGKKICIINAGGTLGMVERGDEVVPPRDADEFKSYFSSLSSIAETVEFVTLFVPRDSINIFPDQWMKIARYIYDNRDAGFDGFVVVHGTDTMAFSASAVAFALGRNLTFPVVFTGSQTTPDVAHGDAHTNLYRACEVAKQDIPEVVISFGNFVYRAVRAQKKDDRRFEGFESPTYPHLAEITGEITVRSELLRISKRETKIIKRDKDIDLQAEFMPSIILIQQFPGLEPSFFDQHIDKSNKISCHGIILQTFGAGNVASELPYSFISFVKEASKQGIPVIITSQYPPDPGTHTKYTPAKAPLKAGAIHAGNMTLASAIAKFQWVLAKVHKLPDWQNMKPKEKIGLVKKLMVKKSIVGEF